MTRGDLALVARLFECWSQDDLEGMLEVVDPEVEWHAAADGRLYRGHAGAREFFERQRDDQSLQVPLQRTTQAGPGRVLAVGRLRLMRPGQGLADSPGVWIFHVANGRITLIESFASEREAMASLPAVASV